MFLKVVLYMLWTIVSSTDFLKALFDGFYENERREEREEEKNEKQEKKEKKKKKKEENNERKNKKRKGIIINSKTKEKQEEKKYRTYRKCHVHLLLLMKLPPLPRKFLYNVIFVFSVAKRPRKGASERSWLSL